MSVYYNNLGKGNKKHKGATMCKLWFTFIIIILIFFQNNLFADCKKGFDF